MIKPPTIALAIPLDGPAEEEKTGVLVRKSRSIAPASSLGDGGDHDHEDRDREQRRERGETSTSTVRPGGAGMCSLVSELGYGGAHLGPVAPGYATDDQLREHVRDQREDEQDDGEVGARRPAACGRAWYWLDSARQRVAGLEEVVQLMASLVADYLRYRDRLADCPAEAEDDRRRRCRRGRRER